MDPFTTLTSVAAPLPQDDIDTDIIYPARFLLITEAVGLGRYAFYDWRFDAAGHERADFALARPPWRGAAIIVTGANFGCGSSREHAAWALRGLGIRAVVAPSFGEIFYNNALKNGLLPIIAGGAEHAELMADAEQARPIVVDLAGAKLRRSDGTAVSFDIDPARREALLNGWDEIDTILAQNAGAIDDFEAAQRRTAPWLWAAEPTSGGHAA